MTPLLGLVLESDAFDRGLAAASRDVDIRPGTFVVIENDSPPHVLAVTRGVRSSGNVFTSQTAAYHLRNPRDLRNHLNETIQLFELEFVATIDQGRVVSYRPRAFLAGSRVVAVDAEALPTMLDIPSEGIVMGHHSSHPSLPVRLSSGDIRGSHIAILGQTGSGKTNLLQLIHQGLAQSVERQVGYVVLDFHDEFAAHSPSEEYLHPPFAFGPSDITFDVIGELLPGLSLAQADLLGGVLEGKHQNLESVIESVTNSSAPEATRRVVTRRLNRLRRARAFSSSNDLPARVAHLSRRTGAGTIIRLGGVQTELAYVFIGRVVRRLMRERMEGNIPPMVILVDEAHRIMSEPSSRSATRSFRFVAQEGRKFGITVILATQRPALVDSTILSQCGTLACLRLTSPDDARAVQTVMGEIRPSDIGRLAVGQGILTRGRARMPLWVDFDLHKRGSSSEHDDSPGLVQQALDF